MVNIVLVSHSSLLAAGIVDMMRMVMQQSQVSIAVAAGADDSSQTLGTDAAKIRDAIEAVYSDDGVLVLMDLGSAVLSAEMALDFLAEEKRNRVRLCAAPFVEGAIAAAIQASLGASLDRVAAEAEGGAVQQDRKSESARGHRRCRTPTVVCASSYD
jgi:Phosphocarrier protein HPr/phosphoenolpyruvate--protein phosphotransferase (EC 2.7.3.9)/PTS system IIA component